MPFEQMPLVAITLTQKNKSNFVRIGILRILEQVLIQILLVRNDGDKSNWVMRQRSISRLENSDTVNARRI